MNLKQVISYGLLIWAVPFVVAMIIFPLRTSNRSLFESIMPVALAAVTLFSARRYFSDKKSNEALKVGFIWMGVSLVIDALMFSRGPMQMSLSQYLSDIGVTYLLIPLITWGMAAGKR
ncbi:hypothetical protein A3A66_00335 [Microgenomates group bacterium RIFCSPLOWO2_01_FULL_46_13]|nr:MAG: hypothetical protein A2783_03855 [Microgenomates group bacterium RIFCSPHIGHO2_01_FULL_45_11]OGV94464.1 MAG: hypothetical protein A3A66_00335 [Microgenomates group bacterium RIFCSPLOWO2_01_FULL_46_13]